MIKFLLSDEVEVKITTDDIRLRSNLTLNKTTKLTKKSFFYTILGFTQAHSGKIGDLKVFVQRFPARTTVESTLLLLELTKIL